MTKKFDARNRKLAIQRKKNEIIRFEMDRKIVPRNV